MTDPATTLLLLRCEVVWPHRGTLGRVLIEATRDGHTVADSIDVPFTEMHSALTANPHMVPLLHDAFAAWVEHDMKREEKPRP